MHPTETTLERPAATLPPAVHCVEDLVRRGASIKRRFLGMYRRANAGHVGAALSCAEILTFTRFAWMGSDDALLLSKGHAAAALYSLLAETGEIPEEWIETFYRNGTLLSAHPPPLGLPGVKFATGSLGHGLSLAAGMVLGDRLLGRAGTVFCVTSDGELDEGSTWEAAMFAAHHRLSRLVWLIDRNGIQGFGSTEAVLALEPLREKLTAFGWRVIEADGHSYESLEAARDEARPHAAAERARPCVIVCHTTKGRGLGTLEGTVDCHYLPLTEARYLAALDSLEGGR